MKEYKNREDVIKIKNKNFSLGQEDEFGRRRIYSIDKKGNVSDEMLTEQIQITLNESPNVNTKDVEILVHSGHVTISGVVNTLPEKFECEDLVHNTDGVHSVINDLEVKNSSRRLNGPLDEFGYN